jgi:hypothetical protein
LLAIDTGVEKADLPRCGRFHGLATLWAVMTVFVDLIFRSKDGSFTFVSWIFVAEALLMIATGAWCLLAPESYVRRMIGPRSRRLLQWRSGSAPQPAPTLAGRFWASHPGWVRFGGAVGIALGIAVIIWLVFFSVAGRLY